MYKSSVRKSINFSAENLHLYHYSGNNPIRYVDPDGKIIDIIWDVAFTSYDVVNAISKTAKGDNSGWIDVGVDALAILIPGVPAGISKIDDAVKLAKTADKVSDITKAADKISDAAKTVKTSPLKTYQTYTKTNPKTGEVYTGRTSGTGSPMSNVRKRDQNHHMNNKGFGPAKLDLTSSNYDAIRGREQKMIDMNGGAKSLGGTSGNAINGISNNNPKKDIYINAYNQEFN